MASDMSVYRVAGLPTGLSKPTARSVIDQFFGVETQTVIRSLGLHPQTNSSVAIAMFFPVPARLLKGSSWKLEETVSYEGALEPRLVRLEIDTHFLGFTPLNSVADGGEDSTIDCILVSGLSSHPFGSWKERGGQYMWLVDDEEAHPPHVRTFLYGYDTSLFRSESFQDIGDIGERLAISIRGIRPRVSPGRTAEPRPTVFIAHSLGGLVVKEAICHMVREEPSVVEDIRGLVFFGVPHMGLLVDPWLRIIEKQPNKQLVEDLRPGSRYLQRLDQEFRKSLQLQGLKVVSIYETLVSKTTKEGEDGAITRSGQSEVLVTPTSALGQWPESVSHTRIAANRSHENLPKFRGRFDEDYLALKPYLEDNWAAPVTKDDLGAVPISGNEQRPSRSGGQIPEAPDTVDASSTGTISIPSTLIPLYPDPETEESVTIPTTLDVIAIHGLIGDSVATWKEGDKLWLRDFLPWSLPKARVLTFGYDGNSLFAGPLSRIRQLATILLDNIKELREKSGATPERKTVFVCHDVGGIIFKQAFVTALEDETRYGDVATSITGILFLGTPHRGPDVGFWSEFLAKVTLLDKSRATLLRHLEARSTELGAICSQFAERCLPLQVFSLYETQVAAGIGDKVVDEMSAILRLPNETALPLEGDHMSMCSYLTSSSHNYVKVAKCIAELFDTMSGKPEQTYFNTSERDLLAHLGAVDAVATLNRIPNHGYAASQWLLDHREFHSWTRLQGRQVLWLHGPPGAGKTVMMRNVVAHLTTRSEAGTTGAGSIISKPVYFFFDDKDSTRKDSLAFVRSALDQILRDSRTSYLMTYIDERDIRKSGPRTEEILWVFLSTILERSRGIMFQFVVDAMDEVLRSSPSYSLTILDRLERLLALDSSGRIRLFISSRKRPHTEFLKADVAFVDADNENTRGNVESFVHAQVQKCLERSFISTVVGDSIEKKILEVAQGNFLHAKLAWEQFSDGVQQWTREDIRAGLDRLNRVSQGLASAYCDLLKSIPPQHKFQARAAFAILRVCRQKLTSRQLALLATLSHDRTRKNDQAKLEALVSQSSDFESYLSEACGYMVRRSEDGIVDFHHVSAKDLFTEHLDGLPPEDQQAIAAYAMSTADAHLMMHQLCMDILELENRNANTWRTTYSKLSRAVVDLRASFKILSSDGLPSKDDTVEMTAFGRSYVSSMGKTPCMLYAIQNWMEHYVVGTPDSQADFRLAAFLRTVSAYYYHMVWFVIQGSPLTYQSSYEIQHTRPKASLLDGLFRALVRGDCPRVVKALIGAGVDVNGLTEETEGVTPLSWAIISERKETFLVLLRNDHVQVNYAPSGAAKPLHYAVRQEDIFYAERLIQHANINVNITSRTGTPLHTIMLFVERINLAAAHLLVDHPDIDIGAKHTTEHGTTTPYILAFKQEIWESVLEKMITIRSKDLTLKTEGMNQLLMVGVYNWDRIEDIILRRDPYQVLDLDPDTGMDVLVTYAFMGRREKLLRILDRIPQRDFPIRRTRQKYDLLHVCADQNWRDLVDLLRERYGLTSLASDHAGRTLLHWALENNWDLSEGDWEAYIPARLDTQDKDGLTVVHAAVSARNMDAIQRLVSRGASILVKDKRGMTAAHLAADQGFRAALEYFIDTPHRDFGRTRTGASLLHILSLWFSGPMVRRFVQSKKALVNVVDKYRRTPLHYAALVNNAAAAAVLLDLGGRLDARDSNGMSPLHEAIRGGNTETAELLLSRGADTRLRDAFGQSCLHLSLRYGHSALTGRFLAAASARDVDAVDHFGMTPLHRACGAGATDEARRLRQRGAEWDVRNRYGLHPIGLAIEARNTGTVKFMISWAQTSGRSAGTVRRHLEAALRLACETEAARIEKILLGEGVRIDRATVRVRRLYMEGPVPESRWPLSSYDPETERRAREQEYAERISREREYYGNMDDYYRGHS